MIAENATRLSVYAVSTRSTIEHSKSGCICWWRRRDGRWLPPTQHPDDVIGRDFCLKLYISISSLLMEVVDVSV